MTSEKQFRFVDRLREAKISLEILLEDVVEANKMEINEKIKERANYGCSFAYEHEDEENSAFQLCLAFKDKDDFCLDSFYCSTMMNKALAKAYENEFGESSAWILDYVKNWNHDLEKLYHFHSFAYEKLCPKSNPDILNTTKKQRQKIVDDYWKWKSESFLDFVKEEMEIEENFKIRARQLYYAKYGIE